MWFVETFSFSKIDCGVDCQFWCARFGTTDPRRNLAKWRRCCNLNQSDSDLRFSLNWSEEKSEAGAISTNQRFCFRFRAELPFETDFMAVLSKGDRLWENWSDLWSHFVPFLPPPPSFQLANWYKITKYVSEIFLFSTPTYNRHKLTSVFLSGESCYIFFSGFHKLYILD